MNELKGGKADKIRTIDALYDYWTNKGYVSKKQLQREIAIGKKIEREHTSDKNKIIEIVFDHLVEDKEYYTKPKPKNWGDKEISKEISESGKNLIKHLIRENITKINKLKRYLNESVVNGKTIINVDIQPEYKNYINFNLDNWVGFLNESEDSNRIVFLYNGEDTLGMINEHDYKMWLLDLGVDETVINNAIFYDKGYAFFRYCMDSGVDENNVADLVKYMISNNINDSREIDEDMWNDFMEETNHSLSDVRDLLENASDMISIPDLMGFIGKFNNIVLTGGGINQCLKEVEIALLALNKPFNILKQFTY